MPNEKEISLAGPKEKVEIQIANASTFLTAVEGYIKDLGAGRQN
jgi:hypothetical protein